MQGKVKKIKDTSTGEYVYPVTVTDGVYVSDGVGATKLTDKLAAFTSSNDWNGKIMNVLGDSITQLITANSTTNYHDYVKTALGLSAVNNYGQSGTCISKVTVGNTTSFTQRYSAMSDNADIITVFGGINDLTQGVVLGTPADTTDSTFYGALKILMGGLTAKYPTKTIVFMTPLKFNNASFGGTQYTSKSSAEPTTYMKELVKAIKDTAGLYAIPVIDLFNTCLNPEDTTVKTTYFADGLHPNAAGHAVIGRRLSKFLYTL